MRVAEGSDLNNMQYYCSKAKPRSIQKRAFTCPQGLHEGPWQHQHLSWRKHLQQLSGKAQPCKLVFTFICLCLVSCCNIVGVNQLHQIDLQIYTSEAAMVCPCVMMYRKIWRKTNRPAQSLQTHVFFREIRISLKHSLGLATTVQRAWYWRPKQMLINSLHTTWLLWLFRLGLQTIPAQKVDYWLCVCVCVYGQWRRSNPWPCPPHSPEDVQLLVLFYFLHSKLLSLSHRRSRIHCPELSRSVCTLGCVLKGLPYR